METIARLAATVEARTGTPAWAVVPMAGATISLIVALFGVFWDVAYHIDHGRDSNLLTPAHLMILFGLTGIAGSAAASIAIATVTGAERAWRLLGLRVPYPALPLGLMGGAAMIGFPLDDLWHRTYGIDVTLWSPTHLLMIGGAVFATIALTLFGAEATRFDGGGPLSRLRNVSLFGALVIGPSVLMLEFDFGVPQWQAVYHPILVAITTAFGLTAARVVLGRWGALKAAAWFAVMRVLLLLFVQANGLSRPAFPLLIGSALLVESAFGLPGRLPLAARAAIAGTVVGTVGMALEWAWTAAVYPMPWHGHMLARMWMPLVAALAAAILGAALGGVAIRRPRAVPAALVAVSLLALTAVLAIPLPRNGNGATAAIETEPASAPRPGLDRYGNPASIQDVYVRLRLSPASIADGADWFDLVSWQGGGHHVAHLVRTASGVYSADQPVPTGGGWKAIALLGRDDVLASTPISFPADPEAGRPAINPEPAADRSFRPSPELITSESHGGPPLVAVLSYLALGLTVLSWVLGLLLAGHAITASPPAAAAAAKAASHGRRGIRPSLG